MSKHYQFEFDMCSVTHPSLKFKWRVRSRVPFLFVCFKGRSGCRRHPLCLMNQIRICRVPQGTAEQDVLYSGLEYLFQKRTCNLGSVLKKQALAADKLEIFLEFQTWAGKAVHIKFNVGYWVSTYKGYHNISWNWKENKSKFDFKNGLALLCSARFCETEFLSFLVFEEWVR